MKWNGVNERMNEINEWRHEIVSRWINESMRQWTNEAMSHWINDWMNEWVDEPVNQWINESLIQWFNESMNQWTSDFMNQWIIDWMDQWMDGWMDGWMNGRAGCFSLLSYISSLSDPFAEAPLLSATFSLSSHLFVLLLLWADSQLALWYSFCYPIILFLCAVTLRLAVSSCNPA